MKKLKIVLPLLLIFLLAGCTTPLRDSKNKVVVYKETGQSVTENILCKPTDKELINIYKKNKVNISKLPDCEDFKVNQGGYEGLWTSLFVKPLGWVIIQIGLIVHNYGLSLIIVGLLIRLALYPVTASTTKQSYRMNKAKPEIQAIEKKYKDKKSQEETMLKSQEMMMVYKKYKINPVSGCLFAFLQLPILFAIMEAANRIPALFEGKLLGFQLGTTPLTALGNGQYQYLIMIVLIIGTTYFSMNQNKQNTSDDMKKQMDFMNRFMIIFISFVSLSLSTAIGFYWITTSIFSIIQNILVKRGHKNEVI